MDIRFVVDALVIVAFVTRRFVKRLFVEVKFVVKKFVVVAEVPVAFTKVKFWRVDEAFARSCWNEETAVVEVAKKLEPKKVLPRTSPATERRWPGVVVPMPTFPARYAFPLSRKRATVVEAELTNSTSWPVPVPA